MLKKITRIIITPFMHIVNMAYRIKVINKEKLPKEGPVILALNHRNYFDIFFIMGQFKDKPIFVGRKSVQTNPLGRLAAWAFDIILVERDGSDSGPLKQMMKTVKSGQILGIFPEGKRLGLHEGQFLSGATYTAIRTNTEILPIGISGPLKLFRKGNVLIVGERFNLLDYMDKDKTTKDRKEIKRLDNILKDKILELTNDGFYDNLK